MRLSGLASGMDTDTMIKELMKAERIKVDKVAQEKQVAEWKQEAYNSLNKQLATFILKSKEDLGLMTKNSMGATFNSSYKNATWVKNVTSSNDAVTAMATSDSMDGVHTIEMAALAKGVSVVSSVSVTSAGRAKTSVLSQLGDQMTGLDKNSEMKFTITGANGAVTFIIGNDSETETLEDGTVKVTKESFNKSQKDDGLNNIVRINKKLDQVSLKEIVDKINNATVNEIRGGEVVSTATLGVKTGYDAGLDKFFIETNEKGKNAVLNFQGEDANGANFLNALKLENPAAGTAVNTLKLKDGDSYTGVGLSAKSSVDMGYGELTVREKMGIKEETPPKPISFDIDINGNKVTIEGTDTMESIKDKINDLTGFTATYVDGRLSINTDGANNEIKISSSGGADTKYLSRSFIDSLNLNVSVGTEANPEELLQNGKKIYAGTNALVKSYKIGDKEFVEDGKPIEYTSNNFTINGIHFSATEVDKASSITVSSNVDGIVDKVKEFVEGYNNIVDQMNMLAGQTTYRDFKPLTVEQRESMSDKEVELWEAKAKSGMLKGDEILSRTIQSVRSGLYENVNGAAYNHLTQIGIATEQYTGGSMGGKLVIDEVVLKQAIQNNAAGVMDLLFKEPTGQLSRDDSELTPAQIAEKRSQSGIVTRMYDNFANGMKEIVNKSGLGNESDILRKVRSKITTDFAIGGSKSRIDNQINEFNKRMDSLNKFLKSKESSYYARFAAMEQAMQRASAQSSWLMQQLGGGAQ